MGDKIQLLLFSQAKVEDDTARLDEQKSRMKDIANHMFHNMHAYPLVALTRDKIVSYNFNMEVPEDWVTDKKTGEINLSLAPAPQYARPNLYNHYQKRIDAYHEIGLTTAQIDEEEMKVDLARAKSWGASVVAVPNGSFRLLRSRDGQLQQGASRYELPPLVAPLSQGAVQPQTMPAAAAPTLKDGPG